MTYIGSGWAIDRALYDWIVENLEEGGTILELGSGTGTRELCKRWNVWSVEHDPNWINPQHNTYGQYIYARITNGWYNADVLKKELPEEYDLILVDGPPGTIGRGPFYDHIDLFNTNVPIIFDDAEREEESVLMRLVSRHVGRTPVTHRGERKTFGVV